MICSSAGIIVALSLFPKHASPAMFFITTLAVVYFVQKIINIEEKADEKGTSEKAILKHHSKAFAVFMFLFLGFVVSFSLWYVSLPDTGQQGLKTKVFSMQEKTIDCIRSSVQGCVTGSGHFQKIFFNNMKVLLITFLFSFFYGAGALFILVWNASVIGAAMGIFMRNSLASVSEVFGLTALASYFGIFSASILRYALHGFFEILAYFVAVLAGGMISLSLLKDGFMTKKFKKVCIDVFVLFCLSTGLVLFAAMVEAYITPLIF